MKHGRQVALFSRRVNDIPKADINLEPGFGFIENRWNPDANTIVLGVSTDLFTGNFVHLKNDAVVNRKGADRLHGGDHVVNGGRTVTKEIDIARAAVQAAVPNQKEGRSLQDKTLPIR